MPEITFIQSHGARETLDVAVGNTIMFAATSHGLEGIVGECGGNAMCATCHVFVEPDQLHLLPAMTDDEDALLDGTAVVRQPNSRLSCQIHVTPALDGFVVHVPGRQI